MVFNKEMAPPHFAGLVLPEDLRTHLYSIAIATQQNNPGFRPMDYAGLHCTVYFYGGFLLESVPAHTRDIVSTMTQTRDPTLQPIRILRLALFPPSKNNLLVAVLDVPEEWHDLRQQLCRSELDDQNPATWVPHVTLGKFSPSDPKTLPLIDTETLYPFGFELKLHGPTLQGCRAP